MKRSRKEWDKIMYNFAYLFLRFMLYSFFGYLTEVAYCSLKTKTFENRGFFCGPVIPVYGFSCIILTFLLKPVSDNIILVSIFGSIIVTALEYFTSYALEKIFHNRWWDYSEEPYNLNGRICLQNMLLFAFGSDIAVFFAEQRFAFLLNLMTPQVLMNVALAIGIIFAIDVVYSIVVAYNLRTRMIVVSDLKKDKLSRIPIIFEAQLTKRLSGLKQFPQRILKAYPYIVNSNKRAFEIMKKIDI